MIKKPPVVVVLGHIDHGKSTLIDYIRKTSITAKEAGGITQSIGAYQIKLKTQNAKRKTAESDFITFIDTPGHEAFEKMRSHGVSAADIGILVVAADEGVKPQTAEAIKAIQEAKLPFVVAFNKIDKPEANVEKAKKELTGHGVFLEGFGGDVPSAEISAQTGKGVKELLDLITLMADVEELKADPAKPASGVVICSSRDSRQGIAATVIVKEGTLRQGDYVKLETTYGKVRALIDFEGKRVKEAGPSQPVQILGLEALPEVGESVRVASSLEEARQETLPIRDDFIPDKLMADQEKKTFSFILKAKEKASLDALAKTFSQVQTQYPDTAFQVVSKEVGDVSSTDIEVASRFGAIILGFGIKIPSVLKNPLQHKRVLVKLFSIVYDLPKIVEEIVKEVSAPKKELEKAELAVLAVFAKSKKGQTIGGKVTKGLIKRGMLLSLQRGDSMAGQGKVINLQHMKKDAGSVGAGKECGILFQGDVEVQAGDVLIEDGK